MFKNLSEKTFFNDNFRRRPFSFSSAADKICELINLFKERVNVWKHFHVNEQQSADTNLDSI